MVDYWGVLVNRCGDSWRGAEKPSDTSWFELRADYKRVAAFGYNDDATRYNEQKKKVFALLDVARGDVYKDKVIQIAEVWKVQTRNEKGEPSFLLDGLQEKIIHEEHPTVWED